MRVQTVMGSVQVDYLSGLWLVGAWGCDQEGREGSWESLRLPVGVRIARSLLEGKRGVLVARLYLLAEPKKGGL